MRSLVRTAALSIVLATVAFAASSALAQATDPAMGTWKANMAKSKYSPGPAPKSLTVKWEPSGKGVKTTAELVSADGTASKPVYIANYDGKDYPITGSAVADTVSLKWDGTILKRVDKKAGKEVQTFERAVAADGKTMTIRHKGKNAKGEAFENLLVLERK